MTLMDNNPLNHILSKRRNSYIIALAPIKLDDQNSSLIENILRDFGYSTYNWLHVTLTQFPNEQLVPKYQQKLTELTASLKSFTVNINGCGFFASQHIVYLRLAKSPELVSLYKKIQNIIYPFFLRSSILNWLWIPHITIAYANARNYLAIASDIHREFKPVSIPITKILLRDLYDLEYIFPLEN